jgi:small GTP-binding protein
MTNGLILDPAPIPLKRHILIADADPYIADTLADRLSDPGRYTITACTSGDQARAEFQEQAFDLLIAKADLPDVDGLTLLRDVQERSPQTVTILIVPQGSDPPSMGLPAQYSFAQPFDIRELVDTIHSLFPPQSVAIPQHKPTVYKVILGGDANVGKTSLIQRYCTGVFDPTRAMTVGIDFHVYDVQVERMPVRLVVWDLGGQERFAHTRNGFYRGCKAVGLVFDASNRTSFYNLMRWWRELRRYLHDVPVLLLANKIELPRQISHDEALALAKAWGIPLFESSCATGAGVTEFFEALAQCACRHSPAG